MEIQRPQQSQTSNSLPKLPERFRALFESPERSWDSRIDWAKEDDIQHGGRMGGEVDEGLGDDPFGASPDPVPLSERIASSDNSPTMRPRRKPVLALAAPIESKPSKTPPISLRDSPVSTTATTPPYGGIDEDIRDDLLDASSFDPAHFPTRSASADSPVTTIATPPLRDPRSQSMSRNTLLPPLTPPTLSTLSGTTATISKPERTGSGRAMKMHKESFLQRRDSMASCFLEELDSSITKGKLAELSASTGGIQIIWNKTLNTTAGRARWRREAVPVKTPDDVVISKTYKHYASIDLAVKVIDDELRLLNVVAHEFCHLATFMVTGVSNNPHGKEFKAWASKCSREFSHRGIQVTTKHSYDIDYKYVWECMDCKYEYKRHSKSIDPDRARCGSCKGALKQTKPAPRTAVALSKYQQFVKEQMKIIRAENSAITQRDMMKVVSQRWAAENAATGSGNTTQADEEKNPRSVELTRALAILEL